MPLGYSISVSYHNKKKSDLMLCIIHWARHLWTLLSRMTRPLWLVIVWLFCRFMFDNLSTQQSEDLLRQHGGHCFYLVSHFLDPQSYQMTIRFECVFVTVSQCTCAVVCYDCNDILFTVKKMAVFSSIMP